MDEKKTGTLTLKTGLAEMLKGGVIMDVTTPEQAKIAEDAGAVAVMALERVPADIRRTAASRAWPTPTIVTRIMDAVSIPVMAKCRIGHFAEARVLEALGVDFIDESEVLTPADEAHHVDKLAFKVPFVCGCRDLGEALRRIGEGAALVRTKGEAGTGNIVEAVRHMRAVTSGIRRLTHAPARGADGRGQEPRRALRARARSSAETGRLPVPNFAAGGIATPADAALMMALGAESVFVGSGIFKSSGPGAAGEGHRARHHALAGRRRSWPRSRAGSARPCAASRSRRSPRASGSRRGAGDARARSASSPCRATSPPTPRPSATLGVRGARGAARRASSRASPAS